MADQQTPRERARARTHAEILAAARSQLREQGADRLSLRAAAREVGMVSSAVYRYFSCRDDLLTALIIESYAALGKAVEEATAGHAAPARRFLRGCTTFHDWARANPYDYALIYGSPVPGYQAPETTIEPAGRAPLALLRVVAQAHEDGLLLPPESSPPTSATLRRQSRDLDAALGTGLPEDLVLRFAHAWAQVAGLVGLDVFGQLKGSYDPADAFARHTFQVAAAHIGFSIAR